MQLRTLALASLPIVAAPSALAAQILDEPTIRADIELAEASPTSSSQVVLAQSSTHVVFVAQGGEDPRIWVSDGTPAGTHSLDQTNSGAALTFNQIAFFASGRLGATLPNGNFVISAEVEGVGQEPVLIDPQLGTAELIADLTPGPGGSVPSSIVSWSGEVWFRAVFPSSPETLYSTDGTAAGTQPRIVLPAGTQAGYLFASSGPLYLLAAGTQPGLWAYDGTSASLLASSTVPIADSQLDRQALVDGQRLYLPLNDGVNGIEPWTTDGTAAGTYSLGDLEPGLASSGPRFLAVSGGTALFAARSAGLGVEYYLTDGTAQGTSLLGDLAPGPASAAPFPGTASAIAGGFVFPVLEDAPFATTNRTEPYVSGTTPGSAVQLLNLGSQEAAGTDFEALGGSVYFQVNEQVSGAELWVTDGTPAGTSLAADLLPGSEGSGVQPLATLGSMLFAPANTGQGLEPHVSDGTQAGTVQLANTVQDQQSLGSDPRALVRDGNRIVFNADTEDFGRELYVLGRDDQNASQVTDLDPIDLGISPLFADDFQPSPIEVLGDRAVVHLEGSGISARVGAIDLNSGDYEELFVLNTPFAQAPQLAVVGDEALLVARNASSSSFSLRKTDGTPAGTAVVDDTLNYSNFGSEIAAFGDAAYFRASDNGSDFNLWRSDGSAPELAAVLEQGPIGTTLQFLGNVADERLFFLTGTSPLGLYSYSADGTLESLGAVVDPDGQGAFLAESVVTDFGLVFETRGTSSSIAADVYVSDGTPGGTTALNVFATPTLDDEISALVAAGDVAYFWTQEDGQGPWTLWRTGGTLASTVQLEQLDLPLPSAGAQLGSGRSAIFDLTVSPGESSLWLVDESGAPIELAVDLETDSFSLFNPFSGRLGDELIFAADDGQAGLEVHALPIVELGGYVAEPYGTPCGDATIDSSGQARLGETLTVEVDAGPSTVAGLYVSAEQAVGAIAPDCGVWIGAPVPANLYLAPY